MSKESGNGWMCKAGNIFVLAAIALAAHAEPIPPEPQMFLDGSMLMVGYEADPAALRELLPKGLEVHPSNMVILNQYIVPDAAKTSGLGAYTLTYLAIQVKGHDGYMAGSPDPVPGRYMAYYWNSSEAMRAYTRRGGFPDSGAGLTYVERDGLKLSTGLAVDGQNFIEVRAEVGGDWSPPFGGQNNYFGQRGGVPVKFPLPYVCKAMKTDNTTVSFSMPTSHPAAKLNPRKLIWAAHLNCDIVYPQGILLKN